MGQMSKSKGNVVPADDVADKYGADTSRMFALFAAPPERDVDWTDAGVEGIYRFLSRIYRFATRNLPAPAGCGDGSSDAKVLGKLHRTLKKITLDFDTRWHFNTSIAAIMELVNEMYLEEAHISPSAMAQILRILTLMVAPFAPYLAAELWEEQGGEGAVFRQPWPAFDPDLARESEVEIVVQINGKVRARMIVPADTDEQGLVSLAEDDDKIQAQVAGRTVVKVIAVPGRLINLVVK